MNNLIYFCCIGILVSTNQITFETNIEIDKMSFSYGYNITNFGLNNDCHYMEYYFSGDNVEYLIPYKSNVSYDESFNIPYNLSMIYEKKMYYRQPTNYTFTPFLKGFYNKKYCSILYENLYETFSRGTK